MKLTREQIEDWRDDINELVSEPSHREQLNALCDLALAGLHEGKPVAWMIDDSLLNERTVTTDEWEAKNMAGADKCKVTPLYASPLAAGWQPMETAPKDGTRILAVWPRRMMDDDFQAVGEITGYEMCVTFMNGGAWVEPDYLDAIGEGFGDDDAYTPEPTHWQPLPLQPSGDKP